MGEIKGFVFSLAVFIGIIVPIFLTVMLGGLHQYSFMKMTTEVSEIVKEEGGVTSRVNNIVGKLSDRNYVITFTDEDGNAVDGRRSFGERVIIEYEYTYKDARGIQDLQTQNMVHISRR